ncbi:MAG: hypothetical protein KME07_06790 [Pegethrix bostrychoides GSE-TBD4-15B]|uniref:Uncharacterized protein n=1 Tax=Pegethrix bostrychoides GSE-TBD4-15B TaxID=2839662 RepID=A0A951U3Y1_9CYAN|nr:hypothetical protein [Pegethrix bostrychoides GSE-TBD4-15B]
MFSRMSDLAKLLLGALLITDFSFIALHLLFRYTYFSTDIGLALEVDRGFSEIFQYLKEFWIALALGFLALRYRSWLYGVLATLFFYILLDDAAKLHEKSGAVISQRFAFSDLWGLQAQDFGELLFYSGVMLVFAGLIALAYPTGQTAAKRTVRQLIVLLGLFACFAIGADLLHSAIRIPVLDPLLIALEDGGELIAMSIIATYIFVRLEQASRTHLSIEMHKTDSVNS